MNCNVGNPWMFYRCGQGYIIGPCVWIAFGTSSVRAHQCRPGLYIYVFCWHNLLRARKGLLQHNNLGFNIVERSIHDSRCFQGAAIVFSFFIRSESSTTEYDLNRFLFERNLLLIIYYVVFSFCINVSMMGFTPVKLLVFSTRDTSVRQWRQLHPCPWSLPPCPWSLPPCLW